MLRLLMVSVAFLLLACTPTQPPTATTTRASTNDGFSGGTSFAANATPSPMPITTIGKNSADHWSSELGYFEHEGIRCYVFREVWYDKPTEGISCVRK